MKYLDEFRDPAAVARLAAHIRSLVTRPWTLMEVCGGQTHGIVRSGIDRLLPPQVSLLHGPGCPVCVTPSGVIDAAVVLAARPEVTVCSFGDMLRVPGSGGDLIAARAAGGDVRMVYGPLDALEVARRCPDREVVFLAVGFETTIPGTAAAVARAAAEDVRNFSVLCAHVRVPPALEALLALPDNRVQAFLAAGHVCTIMGLAEYAPIALRHRVPIVATGFEPVDLLQGIAMALAQLERGQACVENQYSRLVRADGNPDARSLIQAVFQVADRPWRGFGTIAGAGFELRPAFAAFDAERRHGRIAAAVEPAASPCASAQVLRGAMRPDRCAMFATRCTPERPLGPTMVSPEGACNAYFRYRGAAGA
ncbi:MAG: hydrogenase formation protein HypD [Gammaproteobacteria bacterium]